VTDRNGIVPIAKIMQALGHEIESPELPDWVQSWLAAEDQRPWPPQM